MSDPTIITEVDVVDPLIAWARVYVTCEECGDTGEAMDMVRDGGAWLCRPCDNAAVAEWVAQQAYLRRLPW